MGPRDRDQTRNAMVPSGLCYLMGSRFEQTCKKTCARWGAHRDYLIRRPQSDRPLLQRQLENVQMRSIVSYTAIFLLVVASLSTALGVMMYSRATSELGTNEQRYYAARNAQQEARERGDFDRARTLTIAVVSHEESIAMAMNEFGPAKTMIYCSGAALSRRFRAPIFEGAGAVAFSARSIRCILPNIAQGRARLSSPNPRADLVQSQAKQTGDIRNE